MLYSTEGSRKKGLIYSVIVECNYNAGTATCEGVRRPVRRGGRQREGEAGRLTGRSGKRGAFLAYNTFCFYYSYYLTVVYFFRHRFHARITHPSIQIQGNFRL